MNQFIEFQKSEQSIPEHFEQQVRKSPNHVAVKTQDHVWTYCELNEKANYIAHALLRLCPTAKRVALLFEDDASRIAGILGALKVGQTYVPLDPDYPCAWLEYILHDSQVQVILTDDQNLYLAQILQVNHIRLVNIDDNKLSGQYFENIGLTVAVDQVAYLLYTSGTTGRPKGVIQNHRNTLHFIRNYTNHLHITANDRLTLLSSYSFDAAIVDIFVALLNGATLYPINLRKENLVNLSTWLIQQEITIYHSTPTVYRHWINTFLGKEQFCHLRLVVLGGEPMVQSDVDSYKTYFSTECLLVNLLGSTESTINSLYVINQKNDNQYSVVPVGYPITDTEILLLDEAGIETKDYGEIAIKSTYIALGYWQKPELTKAVFFPTSKEGNQRIYRTGDMGHKRPDGCFEWVGRKDFQVIETRTVSL